MLLFPSATSDAPPKGRHTNHGLSRHLKPMRRPSNMPEEEWHRSAVQLVGRVGVVQTAFLFGTTPETIERWQAALRSGGDES